MTSFAPTAPNPMVSVDRRRSMFKSFCGAVLGVAIVATADFVLAQLTHVGSLPTAAKEFAQQSALLAQAGDREGAVEASRKAVDAYRRLVHGSPVHYEPGLAASLHDLSLRLSEAGDTAGARVAIEEAIVMRRRWARYSARYAEGLAQSLALLTTIEMAAGDCAVSGKPIMKDSRLKGERDWNNSEGNDWSRYLQQFCPESTHRFFGL